MGSWMRQNEVAVTAVSREDAPCRRVFAHACHDRKSWWEGDRGNCGLRHSELPWSLPGNGIRRVSPGIALQVRKKMAELTSPLPATMSRAWPWFKAARSRLN